MFERGTSFLDFSLARLRVPEIFTHFPRILSFLLSTVSLFLTGFRTVPPLRLGRPTLLTYSTFGAVLHADLTSLLGRSKTRQLESVLYLSPPSTL